MRNQVFKKLFSVLLALIMVAGLLPASVLAEGEGNAETTPAPTEAVQPTESAEPTAPTETETPEVTEVPEPTPENPAATVEPTQGEPTADPTDEGIMPANVMPVQASVAARDISKDGFIRIFHLDCGRKYFSVSEIEGIIDQLAANNYTHIQLAFGNNGFRFILNDMSVTVGDKTYGSNTVKNAITNGNSTYSSSKNTASTTLSQSDMDDIISYAKSKSIGVIPMLNTPGHMDALVSAMQTLGIRSTTGSEMDLTSEAEVNFIEALQQKYITYFAEKGSDHYNFAADEYSFSNLSDAGYTKFAEYVNTLANMVKKANMTPMAYNDGIYYSGKTTSVPFDTDIQICYWAQATNYASVQELAAKNFKIINNNDAWYYVLGDYLYSAWEKGQWGYEDALKGIGNTPVTQAKNAAEGEIELAGSVLCCWCDGPSIGYTDNCNRTKQTNQESVYALIKAMADANPDYFKKEAANVPAVEISENAANVKTTKETVDGKTVYKAAVKADGTSTIQLNVVNIDNTVKWASDNDEIATVNENGLVTFTGVAGPVTITATPVAATRSINGTAAYSITFNVTKEGEVPQIDKDITVVEGGTATDVIEGYDYSNGTYTTENATVATVESVIYEKVEGGTEFVEGSTVTANSEYVIKYNGKYIKADGSMTDNIDEAAKWTWYAYSSTQGRFTNSGKYLCYNGNNGFTVVTNNNYNSWALISGQSLLMYDGNGYNVALTYGTVSSAEPVDGTKVTFKGVAKGDTYVQIGHVGYTIHVVEEDLTNATTLPIQLWITNVAIEVTGVTTKGSAEFNDWGNGGYAQYILVKAESAYGEKGVLLSSLVPPAVKDKAVTAIDDRDALYSIWKGVVLNTTTGLQKYWWTDMTMADGRVDYQYVRYYGGAWAVSADRVNWTEVTGEGSTGSSSNCKEQVIAYYMQRTDVTTEVITDVVDWGNPTNKWTETNVTQYVILDFAVQYPTERKPNKFPVDGKTVYFHCDESDSTGAVSQDTNSNYYRRIGLIKGIDTTNYEVYMITVTPTSDTITEQLTNSSTALTTSITLEYKGTEKVVWVDDEANLPAEFASADAKYKSISGKFEYKVGGEPNVPGLEIYQRQGMLVTYYLRAKVVEDILYVHYIDRSANDYEFHNYTISVGKGTTFKEGINRGDPWKGYLINGDVKNIVGEVERVTADLSQMPQIGAQYRYSDYTCEEVIRSKDGKDVYLYYTFKSDVTFVVDFGLPLIITPDKVSTNLSGAPILNVIVNKTSQYADVAVNSDKSITYTLNRMISGKDNIGITYSGTNSTTHENGEVSYTVTIIPATNVYYEDSFAKFTDGSGAAVDAKWTADGKAVNDSPTQALEALGQENHKPYGYDPAYDSCTMFSMGSARKVTVTSDMAKDGVVWPTAQFTFKGTGFDIISLTDNTSGAIFVDVYNTNTGNKEKSVFVDNYYGYTYNSETNTWDATPEKANALYQIPVIALRNLPYAEYNVVIKVAYSEYFDHTAKPQGSYSFWLDAVRVYDPMGVDNDIYNTENEKEGYPQYIKLRDELAKTENTTVKVKTTVFIDGGNTADIATYANIGPNNEVYLANGQAITFKLTGNLDKIAAVQIGAKSPNSDKTNKANMTIGSTEKQLNTATEMYYDITDAAKTGNAITVTNNGGAILSLTNLKITYTAKDSVSLGELTDVEKSEAVATVRALFAPAPIEPEPEPEPEKTFEPERFEASWSRNVMQGRKATLTVKTSEDVEAITVDGQTIRSYRTRTERVGFGRRAKRITYREFTYSMVAQESADFSVTSINAEGIESEAITARLTVKTRPNSMRDMWDWFKGWF